MPLGLVLEEGKQFADTIVVGGGPIRVVSERVVASWANEGFSGLLHYPINVESAPPHIAAIRHRPEYFHLELTGRCEFDYEAAQVEVERCPGCTLTRLRQLNPDRGMNQHPFIIRRETWDGSDFFVSLDFPWVMFCTRRVYLHTRKCKFTGFEFRVPEAKHEGDYGRLP